MATWSMAVLLRLRLERDDCGAVGYRVARGGSHFIQSASWTADRVTAVRSPLPATLRLCLWLRASTLRLAGDGCRGLLRCARPRRLTLAEFSAEWSARGRRKEHRLCSLDESDTTMILDNFGRRRRTQCMNTSVVKCKNQVLKRLVILKRFNNQPNLLTEISRQMSSNPVSANCCRA